MNDEPKSIRALLFNSGWEVRIVNLITFYRIVTFPLLVIIMFFNLLPVFRWMLLASFVTDALDGFLARKLGAVTVLGAKLDSLGDNLTILAALTGLVWLRFDFIREQSMWFLITGVLFIAQVSFALWKYGEVTSFHTFLAKAAALLQGIFVLSFFFLEQVIYSLFYLAMLVTIFELIEELLIIYYLKKPKENVRGIFWVLRERRSH